MKKITMVLSALMLLMGAAVANAALSVGIIDLPGILQQSPQVAAMSQKLKDQFTPQQQAIVNLQNKIRSEAQQLSPQNPTKLTDQQRQTLQNQITADQKQLQQMVMQFQDNVTKAQNAAMQQVMTEINNAVKTIASKQNLDIVLLKPAVIYAANTTDITSQVLDALPKK